ncbi:prevent-host-death protein [Rothia nasimurium]|uniref:prevent-host-death protein n=1 Tax=Rothia nasimurium TaxID=85336 RepID=UPI001F43DB61|nr:prevent-host-death protein [Rothia nasimurium]
MSTLTYARTFNSSELSRNPKPVFEAVESQPVLVTRRDGENLVLMTEHEADERRDMFLIAAQIIAATTLEGGSLAERMATVFPWMLALDTGDRELCARELIDTARAAFATNQPKTLLVGVTSWFESATALAAGLDEVEPEWLPEPVNLEVP